MTLTQSVAETFTHRYQGEELVVGRTKHTRSHFELRGRAASHSGYSSTFVDDADSMSQQDIEVFLNKRIRKFQKMPYLVGTSDYEGWPMIFGHSTAFNGAKWSVRIPQWHSGELLAYLHSLGMDMIDRTNHLMAHPDWEKSQYKKELAPLFEPGSRPQPEAWLVTLIKRHRERQGFEAVCRQGDLFSFAQI
jgi:hypothetical protein